MKYSILILITTLMFSMVYAQVDQKDNTATVTDSNLVKKADSLQFVNLHFYRRYIPKVQASVKKVPIYINDSLVYELKANTVVSMKVGIMSKLRISVDRKRDTEIEIKVKPGKEYFFKCEVHGGFLNSKITIDTVSPAIGREESGILEKQ